MLFNGSTQNLDISYTSDFDLSSGDFALMTWIKTTSLSDDVIGAFNSGSPFLGFSLSIWNIGQVAVFYSGGPFQTFNSADVNDGNEYHIAVLNISGTAYCYVNGAFVQSIVAGNPSGTSNQTIRIGRDSNASPSRWFSGTLWDTRIYKNKVLSASDIKNIYNSRGSDNITDGMVLRSSMIGKTSGTSETSTMYDLSGNGNDASPVASPTYTAELVKTNKRRR